MALRRYASKRLTNDQLDAVEVDWRDRGAVAVKQMAWHLYDDLHTHRAVSRFALSRELRRNVARWIVFLLSDEEYLWPEFSFIQAGTALGNLLTLGLFGRLRKRRWGEFTQAGSFEYWPFVSHEQQLAAMAKCRLLRGGDA